MTRGTFTIRLLIGEFVTTATGACRNIQPQLSTDTPDTNLLKEKRTSLFLGLLGTNLVMYIP
jgi:hypothetical protein